MSTKIFVGRLADGTSNDELHSLFRKYGNVTEAVTMGNYGFVVRKQIIILIITKTEIIMMLSHQGHCVVTICTYGCQTVSKQQFMNHNWLSISPETTPRKSALCHLLDLQHVTE